MLYFPYNHEHTLEWLFQLEQLFTLLPLPLRPVSGRRHDLHIDGYRYVKNVPLPLSPVSPSAPLPSFAVTVSVRTPRYRYPPLAVTAVTVISRYQTLTAGRV